MKDICWCRESNPALQIQSQLCLPPNHEISKLHEKMMKFEKIVWPGIFEVNFKAIFENENAKKKFTNEENFWKEIVI